MKNNYEFWENYILLVKDEIKKLCSKKENIYIDLHMHSNYSADGKQNIKQILESTKHFDIISITDHDTVKSYDEIFEYVKNGITKPIIIPGVEFTTYNREYGPQCHLLQLFINPKDKVLLNDLDKNYKATFKRSKIQFKRINNNLALQEIIDKYGITISYNEYLNYLNEYKLIPEYDTLCVYLMNKFKSKNIKTFDILKLLEKYNKADIYIDRKKFKEKRYKKLRDKYIYSEENFYNVRFLLSMLAVREVDDDWWDEPSSGSLSVNSYGQLKISELNTKYNIYFAHPTEKSLNVVEDIIKSKSNIVGLELNIRNEYDDISKFYDLIEKYKLVKIIGSDSHDNTSKFYKEMDFYKICAYDVLKIIN